MKCSKCRELEKTEPFIRGNIISSKWATHLQDTHGLPAKFLPDMVNFCITRKKKSHNDKRTGVK